MLSVEVGDPTAVLHELTGWALQHATTLPQLTVERPSLEDVYLQLTGQDTATPAPGQPPARRPGRRPPVHQR
jgi:ABC-2 type transport system ATP-binding protein